TPLEIPRYHPVEVAARAGRLVPDVPGPARRQAADPADSTPEDPPQGVLSERPANPKHTKTAPGSIEPRWLRAPAAAQSERRPPDRDQRCNCGRNTTREEIVANSAERSRDA